MPDWSYLLAKLITTIGSWIDAGNLRNVVFKLKNENEILVTALDDIVRMDKGRKSGKYAAEVLKRINKE
jgi:predicted KAP-like P-loop ATPase